MATNLVSFYGSTYSSLYFGVIISTVFYGVACMQTFFYYVHYQNDPFPIKIFVAIMWALNTIHEALSISGAYKSIIFSLVNPLSYVIGTPELILLYLLTPLVGLPTQGFLVYRIYIFSGKNIVTPLVWIALALVQLVCATIYVGKALYSANGGVHVVSINTLGGSSFMILAIICFSVAVGVDVLIAIFMTFLLARERTATSFASTAHILQRLIVFAVNTGIWTATFALLSITLLHLFPLTLIYTVFAFPLCPVYCNTLLANLNARAYIRDEATTYNIDEDIIQLRAYPIATRAANNVET